MACRLRSRLLLSRPPRRPSASVGFALAPLLALGIALAIPAGCSRSPHEPQPSVTATPTPAPGAPVFAPERAATMTLSAEPLGISPDGLARWLVRVRFAGADGAPTQLLRGGDVAFVPTHGSAQWQTRLRFAAPAAIVSTTVDGPLAIDVRANFPLAARERTAATDTRRWRGPRVVARALGPHVVQIGWFPPARQNVRVTRTSGGRTTSANVAAPSSTYTDTAVEPGSLARYVVTIPRRGRAAFAVRVPPEAAHGPLSALSGKGMWLSFSPSPLDADGYDKLEPAAIVARARAAGVHSIELRTAYGPFSELDADTRPAIDALLDAAAARGIAIVAWTVPRGTDYDDLARAVAATAYRTRRGHGFAALAVDVERGDDFLGSGPAGFAAIGTYVARLRAALGPHYPLVATVEDPYLGHLGSGDYPYAAVAAQVDALQPMVYWRMMSARAVTPAAVRQIVRASYAATLRAAGRRIAIDIGGQTAGGGSRGAPPPAEIAAAVDAAADCGALGVTFFDWNATTQGQWQALARTSWKDDAWQ